MIGREIDPKGLIREAYRIEGIGEAECRSIFMDWALSLPEGEAVTNALPLLIAHYAEAAPDHPMSAVLREGLAAGRPPARRGGWRGRRGGSKD